MTATFTITLTEMRILCCGSRHWSDVDLIRVILRSIERQLRDNKMQPVIIHGCAKGADTLCGDEAKRLGWDVLEFPADWQKYGRAAGPIRNKQMLDEGKPGLVIAFSYDLSKSKGTANMVEQATKRGIPVAVCGEEGERIQPTLHDYIDTLTGEDIEENDPEDSPY